MAVQKNKMGVVQFTILTIVNMTDGIIMLPTMLAAVGTISIFSWLLTVAGAMILAYSFAKCGMYNRKSGGMGGYAEYSFGKAGNFLANYAYSISLLIANVGISISVVSYASEFFGVSLSPAEAAMWAILIIWGSMALNFWGARLTGSFSTIAALGTLGPVLVLGVIGWFWFDSQTYVAAWNPHQMPLFAAIGSAISTTLWAFLGLESACANMDTVENPEKNVPIAVLLATIGIGVFSLLYSNVIAGIVPNAELAASSAPFGLAFAKMFGDTAGKVVMFMMIAACGGALISWQFTMAQVFLAGSIQGYFPNVFRRVTKANVPIAGMIILVTLQSGIILMTMSPSLVEQFNVLLQLAVVTNLVPYILSMAALDVMQRSLGFDSKVTSTCALLGAVYSLYACYECGTDAMTYGSLVTFAGWTFYGLIAKKYQSFPLLKKKASHEKHRLPVEN